MRAIGLLGWFSLAASAAAALIGGSCPAMARANPPVTHVHEVSVGAAILSTGLYDIECNALFLGDIETPIGPGPSLAIIGSFTYSRCTAGCIFNEENGPLEIRVTGAGGETGTISYFLSHLDCAGFVNCTYKKGPIRARRKGPSASSKPNGEMSIQGETMLKESGALCLDTGRLDIVTTPLEPGALGG